MNCLAHIQAQELVPPRVARMVTAPCLLAHYYVLEISKTLAVLEQTLNGNTHAGARNTTR